MIFKKRDLLQFQKKRIDPKSIQKQISYFVSGIKPVNIDRPATPGDGIEIVDNDRMILYAGLYDKYRNSFRKVRFIPASGAASRMFKDLFDALHIFSSTSYDTETWLKNHPEISDFLKNIHQYPFSRELNEICRSKYTDINNLITQKKYAEILQLLLQEEGLNYGNLPKGLLKFHIYENESRTALEEHFFEAEQYLIDSDQSLHLHFTVSPEFKHSFEEISDKAIKGFKERGVLLEIDYSVQDPSTDTIAVYLNNRPFRSDDGSILFRPGGHGALLHNLGELEDELIFIGNIDNVTIDILKPKRVLYKKILGGYLIEKINIIRQLLHDLENNYSDTLKNNILKFTRENISQSVYETLVNLNDTGFVSYARMTLHRPVRVCGMVRNQGEPGGGPFWVIGNDGQITKQIIESSQINLQDPSQKQAFYSSTHFNPVDIACTFRDYKGCKFNLTDFRDDDMAFISVKSSGGRDLKALELPGLWNGGMAGWITFFIEVPVDTFSPVKNVFDLLRPEHLNLLK